MESKRRKQPSRVVAAEHEVSTLAVVLAGGAGTRLRPLSHPLYPKPLLTLIESEGKLLQGALARVVPHAVTVVCGADVGEAVWEELEQSKSRVLQLLLEPEPRGTAMAVAVATLRAPVGTTVCVVPSDHYVQDLKEWDRALRRALLLASSVDRVVLLGVPPRSASSSYGYIERGWPLGSGVERTWSVRQFVEKPHPDRAVQYVASGNWYWNSGVFVARREVWQQALRRYAPRVLHAAEAAWQLAQSDSSRGAPWIRLASKAYRELSTEVSVDTGLLERMTSEELAVVELDAGWSDVGTWPALYDTVTKDAQGNVIRGNGVRVQDVERSLVWSTTERPVVVAGLRDAVIVETADAVLVAAREALSRERIEWPALPALPTARRIARPWGAFERLWSGEGAQLKRLVLKPGAAISLQRHRLREEHWVVVRGVARVTVGDRVWTVSAHSAAAFVPRGALHRVENVQEAEELELLELQLGEVLSEEDIERIEDRYGRA